MTGERMRRRWITFGELIGFAALIVSALGLWIAWKNSNSDKTTRIVEQPLKVPLALRGAADRNGRTMTIMPADPSHALESLTISIRGAPAIDVGSDGKLGASAVETALRGRDKEAKDVMHSVPIRIEARYVEAGSDRRGGGSYALRYKWEGGGLFGGRSLRLHALSRA